MEKFKFENVNVYKESISFALEIYKLTKSWPKEELFGLTNQIRRASTSISLNIAEVQVDLKRNLDTF